MMTTSNSETVFKIPVGKITITGRVLSILPGHEWGSSDEVNVLNPDHIGNFTFIGENVQFHYSQQMTPRVTVTFRSNHFPEPHLRIDKTILTFTACKNGPEIIREGKGVSYSYWVRLADSEKGKFYMLLMDIDLAFRKGSS